MSELLDRRLQSVLSSVVTPPLRRHGFRKKGLNYVSVSEEMSWLVNVQKSQWSARGEVQFTLNAGAYVPGVVSCFSGRDEPKKPTLADCCLSARIGMLGPWHVDKWWELTESNGSNSALSEVAEDLEGCVQDWLIPFLLKLRSPAVVADLLAGPISESNKFLNPRSVPQRLAYSALIHLRACDRRKAQEQMDKAVEQARNTPLQETMEKVSRLVAEE